MKRVKLSTTIIFVVAFLCVALFAIYSAIQFDYRSPTMEIYANNSYEETLVVVADGEYPPFSFENSKGEMV